MGTRGIHGVDIVEPETGSHINDVVSIRDWEGEKSST